MCVREKDRELSSTHTLQHPHVGLHEVLRNAAKFLKRGIFSKAGFSLANIASRERTGDSLAMRWGACHRGTGEERGSKRAEPAPDKHSTDSASRAPNLAATLRYVACESLIWYPV